MFAGRIYGSLMKRGETGSVTNFSLAHARAQTAGSHWISTPWRFRGGLKPGGLPSLAPATHGARSAKWGHGEDRRLVNVGWGVMEGGWREHYKEESKGLRGPWRSIRVAPAQRRGLRELIGVRARMQGQKC